MKLMSLENLGFWEPKVSKCWKLSMQALFSFLVLGDVIGVSGVEEEKQNSACFRF